MTGHVLLPMRRSVIREVTTTGQDRTVSVCSRQCVIIVICSRFRSVYEEVEEARLACVSCVAIAIYCT